MEMTRLTANETIHSLDWGIGKLPIHQSAHGQVSRECFKTSSSDIYRQFCSMPLDISLAVVNDIIIDVT